MILLMAVMAIAGGATAKKMSDLKVYINPGHGGYTSNDRPIRLYPYAQNDTAGYWESTSNLYKGLHMYHILDSLGATPYISRIKNTEDDDRSLSGICAEANALGVDLMFSIHSNAGESINMPLILYREETLGVPRYEEAVRLSKIVWQNLYSSQLPIWTRHTEYVCGDLTFYDSQWKGGLGVLRTLYVVGLLSEGSMHEHRPEAHRLMNDDVWWLEAWHFVRSIMEFYDTEDRFVTGNVAGIVYDNHNLRETVMPCNWTKHGRDKLAPLNGTYIELLDAAGKVVQTRTTDKEYNGAFVFRNVAPGNYTVRAAKDGYYVLDKPVEVKANEVTYQDMPMDLKREFPLQVLSYGPKADDGQSVSCASVIEFEFNTDIDVSTFEAAFKIEPEVEGYFTYADSYHKATFTPSLSLARDTPYKVTLAKSVRHPDPFYSQPGMTDDLVFEFRTLNRNRLELIDQFPGEGGTVHLAHPSLEFRFDASLDPKNLFDVVAVKDSKGNAVAVNKRGSSYNKLSNGYGNVIYAITGDLTEGETYTLTLGADLRDRESIPLGAERHFTFKAVDVTHAAQGTTVMLDFENATPPFACNEEISSGIASKGTALKSNDCLFGNYAAKLGYRFADQRLGLVQWDYTGEPVIFNTGDRLGLYINGDFSNHDLQVALTSGTDTKYVSLGALDFRGWQYRDVELTTLEAGYPYLLTGIRVVQNTSPITMNGAIGLDNLTCLAAGAGVEGIEATSGDFRAWPVPARDMLNVAGPDAITSLELYNAAGVKVLEATDASALNVASLVPGVYMLRASTATRTATLRVAVK